MKRGGFLQRRTPLKRTGWLRTNRKPLPRKAKTPIKKLKDALWELCKQIVRARYRLPNGTWQCYTCDSIIDQAKNAHTGHCIPSATGGALLRYDLDNLRIQCFHCNINLGGNGAIYHHRLLRELGAKRVNAMMEKKTQSVQADRAFYENLISAYSKILASFSPSALESHSDLSPSAVVS